MGHDQRLTTCKSQSGIIRPRGIKEIETSRQIWKSKYSWETNNAWKTDFAGEYKKLFADLQLFKEKK